MKKLCVFIFIILLNSCALPPIVEIDANEEIIHGTWSSYTIWTNNKEFFTEVGSRGLYVSVMVVNHNNKWYTWSNKYGYGLEIFPIEN